ncbi:MAG: hypothetical protein F4142_10805 [Nitrospira sp. SB0675_bin_23]|nr:hypothetical protein [Nitrospira sp. SB0675_bin_23]
MSTGEPTPYAHLPEDLIQQMLEAVPRTVEKMETMLGAQDEPIQAGISALRNKDIICKLEPQTPSINSLMAADGGQVIERMSGMDLLLAVAVGVEGLHNKEGDGWKANCNQYEQWQTVMPHDEATPRLCQGAMFLMEIGVLAGATHEIRIMDGAHFTPLLKINSMLSAKEEHAGEEYVAALRGFLRETYRKIIPDIPDIISNALNDPGIIAMAKYSSSRDVLDSHVRSAGVNGITLDDKTFFALGLDSDEYTRPMSVGQSEEERRKIWNDLHIICNLEIKEKEDLNKHLEEAINPIRTKNGKEQKESDLFFTYFKPYANGPAYRIECKRSLATDAERFESVLAGIKQQIIYPDIREPFPQYLADLMAKSVSGGLHALQDAVRLSLVRESTSTDRVDLLFSYRSR